MNLQNGSGILGIIVVSQSGFISFVGWMIMVLMVVIRFQCVVSAFLQLFFKSERVLLALEELVEFVGPVSRSIGPIDKC